MDLHGKVAWLTGGARMGSAVARALSLKGCLIVLTYRKSKEAAETVAQEVIAGGGKAITLECDLSKRLQIEATVETIVKQLGRLDILVNLSSIYEQAPISNAKLAAESWDKHLKVNAESAYTLSIAAGPWMNKGDGGRIVHISDWTSLNGRPRYKDLSAYYVSKAAIKAVVEAMALELAPKVLVNAIAPGPILPPPDMTAAEVEAVIQSTPLARWGGAEEIAKAVLFLVETDFVTGETLQVDGGRHLY